MRIIIFIFSILVFLFCLWFFCYWGIFAPITITHTEVKDFVAEIVKNEFLPYLSLLIFSIVLPFMFLIAAFKFMINKAGKQRWPRIYLIICFVLIMLVFSAGVLRSLSDPLVWGESLIMNVLEIVIPCIIIFTTLGYPIWYLIKAKEARYDK